MGRNHPPVFNLDLGEIPLPTEPLASANTDSKTDSVTIKTQEIQKPIGPCILDEATNINPLPSQLSPGKTPALNRIQQLIKSKAEKLKLEPSSPRTEASKRSQLTFGIGKTRVHDKVKFSVKKLDKPVKLFDDEDSDHESKKPSAGPSSMVPKSRRSSVISVPSTKLSPGEESKDATKLTTPPEQVSQKQSPSKLKTLSIKEKSSVSETLFDTVASHSAADSIAVNQPEQVIAYPIQKLTKIRQSYEADSTIPDAVASPKCTLYSDEEDEYTSAKSTVMLSESVLPVHPPPESLPSLR